MRRSPGPSAGAAGQYEGQQPVSRAVQGCCRGALRVPGRVGGASGEGEAP